MVGEKEVKERIEKEVVVTRHEIALAKAFLCRLSGDSIYESQQLITKFTNMEGYQLPPKFLLHPTADIEQQLQKVIGYFKCYLAMVEAMWGLIYQGRFLAFGVTRGLGQNLEWTTIIPGSGGHSGGWDFPSFNVELPREITVAPSYRYTCSQFLTDPDIFTMEAGLNDADVEVVEALQDAITCYRHDLYRATATMLGKAMEGAWIELGWTLANTLPESSSKKGKYLSRVRGENVSIASKIDTVKELYSTEAFFDELRKASGIHPNELNGAIIWSNAVREARNAIHFGVRPAPPNTYEKVGILLIAGANSLKMLYHIKKEAYSMWPQLADAPIKGDHQP
jgi:hypothetical protein